MGLTARIHKKLHAFALDVAIEAEAGVTALLGASGSGKSMTLKCIAGVETPDSGYIELDGRVLYDSARHIDLPPQKRHIGYLFQNYALFPTMSVAQNIAAGVRKGHAERRRVVAEKLEAFFLTGVADKLPGQLSGGQQQRVALARILASEPQAILLDEPFAALDSYLKWQMEAELMDTLSSFPGITLFVSHDRDEVSRDCSRVIVMQDGVSAPETSVRELFDHPASVSAARLSGCKNFAPAYADADGTVYIPAWGRKLRCMPPAAGEVAYVGLRAHLLHPVADGEENRIPCRIRRVTEQPFSFVLSLRVDGAAEDAPALRMEMTKEAYAALPRDGDALCVAIRAEDVLPLPD